MEGRVMAPNDIACLLKIAELALNWHRAEQAAELVKGDYHNRLFEYRQQHPEEFDGGLNDAPNPDNPDDAGIIEFSAAEYAAYQKAKRMVYNAKRRLKAHAAKVKGSAK